MRCLEEISITDLRDWEARVVGACQSCRGEQVVEGLVGDDADVELDLEFNGEPRRTEMI